MITTAMLFAAIVAVESGGNCYAIGDNGKAVGAAQIWEVVVKDCNQIRKKQQMLYFWHIKVSALVVKIVTGGCLLLLQFRYDEMMLQTFSTNPRIRFLVGKLPSQLKHCPREKLDFVLGPTTLRQVKHLNWEQLIRFRIRALIDAVEKQWLNLDRSSNMQALCLHMVFSVCIAAISKHFPVDAFCIFTDIDNRHRTLSLCIAVSITL